MPLQNLQVNIKGRFLNLISSTHLLETKNIALDIFCRDEQLIDRLVIDYGKNEYYFSDNQSLTAKEKKKLMKVLKPYVEYLIR